VEIQPAQQGRVKCAEGGRARVADTQHIKFGIVALHGRNDSRRQVLV
jgi:hypothetical protein